MITALLWKDFRLSIPILMTAALLFPATFASVFLFTTYMTPGEFPWLAATVAGAYFCQWNMVLVAALLGGNAFASEREDESIRFAHALPIARSDAVFSKLIVTLIAFEILWLILAVVLHATVPFAALGIRERLPGGASMSALAAFSFLVLGAAWYGSARTTRPTTAALAGLIAGALMVAAVAAGLRMIGNDASLETVATWTGPLGLVGLLLGTRVREKETAPQARRRTWPHRNRIRHFANPFRALQWKDYRVASRTILAGAIVLAIPYARPIGLAVLREPALEAFALTTTQTLWLSAVVFAVWGGYIAAAERASQTDRFVSALPIAKRSISLSRLSLTFLPALVIFAANLTAMLALHAAMFRQSPVDEPVHGIFQMTWPLLVWQTNSLLFAMPTFGMPLVCFGVAWLGAIALKRPYLGIGLGAVTPGLVLVLWLAFIAQVEAALLPMQAALLFMFAGFVASLALVAAGTIKASRSAP